MYIYRTTAYPLILTLIFSPAALMLPTRAEQNISNLAIANKKTAKPGVLGAVGIAVGCTLGAVLSVPIATAVLGIIGFASGGVVAGSIAAVIQSAVYGGAVASGSIFALAQSLAAGGAAMIGATTLSGVAAGGVAGAAAAGAAANTDHGDGGEGSEGIAPDTNHPPPPQYSSHSDDEESEIDGHEKRLLPIPTNGDIELKH